jgi:hypothetical protein
MLLLGKIMYILERLAVKKIKRVKKKDKEIKKKII